LATIHQRHRQTDRTDNGLIAQGKPFYKRSPKNESHSHNPDHAVFGFAIHKLFTTYHI